LARMAEAGGGAFHHLPTPDHIASVIMREVDGISTASASDLALYVAPAAETLDPARWRGRGIAPVARAYFRLIVESTRRHQPLIRELVHRSRGRAASTVAEDAYDRFVATVFDPFLTLLRERTAEVRHPDPALAVRVGFSACQAALREALLCPHMRPTMGEIGDERLIAEITRMLCGYLGADQEAGD